MSIFTTFVHGLASAMKYGADLLETNACFDKHQEHYIAMELKCILMKPRALTHKHRRAFLSSVPQSTNFKSDDNGQAMECALVGHRDMSFAEIFGLKGLDIEHIVSLTHDQYIMLEEIKLDILNHEHLG